MKPKPKSHMRLFHFKAFWKHLFTLLALMVGLVISVAFIPLVLFFGLRPPRSSHEPRYY